MPAAAANTSAPASSTAASWTCFSLWKNPPGSWMARWLTYWSAARGQAGPMWEASSR